MKLICAQLTKTTCSIVSGTLGISNVYGPPFANSAEHCPLVDSKTQYNLKVCIMTLLKSASCEFEVVSKYWFHFFHLQNLNFICSQHMVVHKIEPCCRIYSNVDGLYG